VNFFFTIFGCSAHFRRIATKWLEIDQDDLRMKFSALNADFNSLNRFIGFKEACTGEHQRRLPP